MMKALKFCKDSIVNKLFPLSILSFAFVSLGGSVLLTAQTAPPKAPVKIFDSKETSGGIKAEATWKQLGVALQVAAFSHTKNQMVAVEDEGGIRLWDLLQGQPVQSIVIPGDHINRVLFSPSDDRIAFSTQSNAVYVVDVKSQQVFPAMKKHTGLLLSFAFSPDGKKIVTAGSEGMAYLWEVETGKLLATFRGHKGWINVVVFSPDGQWIATAGDDKAARIFSTDPAKSVMFVLSEHKEAILSLALSPDGQKLITTTGEEVVRVWDPKRGVVTLSLQGHKEGVLSARFSSSGKRIVTAGRDETARVWDADNGQMLAAFRDHKGWVVKTAISPNGKYVATVDESFTLRVFSVDAEINLFAGQGLSKAKPLDLTFLSEKQVKVIYDNGYVQTINLS